MTTEQINKAIREEAEKEFPMLSEEEFYSTERDESYFDYGQGVIVNRSNYRAGAKFVLGLSIKPSTNLQQQNENERLNNSEWISVKDKPEKGGRYLVYCKYGVVIMEFTDGRYWKQVEATHWMPLPGPPKEPNPQPECS